MSAKPSTRRARGLGAVGLFGKTGLRLAGERDERNVIGLGGERREPVIVGEGAGVEHDEIVAASHAAQAERVRAFVRRRGEGIARALGEPRESFALFAIGEFGDGLLAAEQIEQARPIGAGRVGEIGVDQQRLAAVADGERGDPGGEPGAVGRRRCCRGDIDAAAEGGALAGLGGAQAAQDQPGRRVGAGARRRRSGVEIARGDDPERRRAEEVAALARRQQRRRAYIRERGRRLRRG